MSAEQATPQIAITVSEYADVHFRIGQAQRLVELASTTLMNRDGKDDQSAVIDLLDLVVDHLRRTAWLLDVPRGRRAAAAAAERPRRPKKGVPAVRAVQRLAGRR